MEFYDHSMKNVCMHLGVGNRLRKMMNFKEK